jgi:hypothetical protein
MVLEHQGDYASQWAAISSIASKIGCTGETLRKWVWRHCGTLTTPERPHQMKTKFQDLSAKRIAQAKRMKLMAANGQRKLQTEDLPPEKRKKMETLVHNLNRMTEIQRFRGGETDGTA